MVTKGIQGDLDAVWNIIDRCRASLRQRGIFQWDMVYPTRETAVQDMNVGGLYVLTSLGQVLAVVTIDTQHEDEYNTVRWTTSEPALIVHRLCVDPEVQGQGIGRRLMEFVEQYAVRQRFSSVRLDAYSGNPRALALYRQRGYRQAGQVFFPRRTMPFHCFELDLTSTTKFSLAP